VKWRGCPDAHLPTRWGIVGGLSRILSMVDIGHFVLVNTAKLRVGSPRSFRLEQQKFERALW
jgi:hypothetical protein